MTASATTLTLLVSVALGITLIAPLLLLGLFIRDWKKGELW